MKRGLTRIPLKFVARGYWGNLSDVSGDLSDVWGDLSNVSGNISDCEITDDDRKNGIKVEDLIKL